MQADRRDYEIRHLLGSARGSRVGDRVLAIVNFCILPLQRFNDSTREPAPA